ncbi:hypothetical protein N7471_002999 [Penicillium samsonianum]|uniref:uncharacterized protein n=1 Tax=Penicillium samsonianum TaxID=1882272 RepID=UPI0025479B76|nr:uncharacterized protein N7471_002999 [Penicillium samsonianum]KAJ6143546.1 hypothetical protein N7471_002999 [Penicillium samsonianum]
MASNPPAACCAVGVKHQGETKGQIQQISNVEVYIPHPERATKRAIVLLTDVFGHRFVNTQLIVDQLAANGFLVAIHT